MKKFKNPTLYINIVIIIMIISCKKPVTELKYNDPDVKIIFLHHSTGSNVWYGDIEKNKRFNFKASMSMVPRLIKEYCDSTGIKINMVEKSFPSGNPYPWRNDPYDYYNIWVKNSGDKPYMEEPTLEMLVKEYDVIIFKHCFPVSKIEEPDGNPDANSNIKTLENYKLQYTAIKDKLYEYPGTKFIVWTGAALVESRTNESEAKRAIEFQKWVKEVWDTPGDNIEIYDFREIETEGGLYLKPEYAASADDSHPNKIVSVKAAKILADKIIEIVEKR